MPVQEYKVTCVKCGDVHVFHLDAGKVKAWQGGVYIQTVFPELSPGERELLISRICEKCFDAMFS